MLHFHVQVWPVMLLRDLARELHSDTGLQATGNWHVLVSSGWFNHVDGTSSSTFFVVAH